MKIRDLVYDVLTEEVKQKKLFLLLLKKWYGDNPTPEQIKKTENDLTYFYEKQASFTLKNPNVNSFLLRWNGKHGKGVVAPRLDDQGSPMFGQNREPITTLVPFKFENLKDPVQFTLEQFEDFINEFRDVELAPEEDEFKGNLRSTPKKVEASKKLWMSGKDAVVDEDGFKVKFIPNASVAVMYGFYQQYMVKKILQGSTGDRQWCVTGRNIEGDSRTNLWSTYRSPINTGYNRIPRRTFWFVYDESKNPDVVEDSNIHKYYLCALQYAVNDYGYTGFVLTSLYNDNDKQVTWDQVVALYPQLDGREEEFARYVEFDESELLGKSKISRITETEGAESDFAAQPRNVKKAYIDGGGTLKSERSWNFMDNSLKNLYITGSEAGEIEDKFQSEELIIAIKKSPEYLKMLDRHIRSKGAAINDATQKATNKDMEDLGIGIIYRKIVTKKYRVAKTSIDNKQIQLIESLEKKYEGEGLSGLFHLGYNDWVVADGIKYTSDYYSDEQTVYSDDEGQVYLVTTYIHVESKQEDNKSLYTIIKTMGKDVEGGEDLDNAEDLAGSEDQVLCHFITAKQFNVLKQRIHERTDGNDEDFDSLSNFDPETDVDIKEMY